MPSIRTTVLLDPERPWGLVCGAGPEHGSEGTLGIFGPHDEIDASANVSRGRERRVTTVAVTETPRAGPTQVPQPDVGKAEPGEKVEFVQRLDPRQVGKVRCSRKRSVLPPLHVDGDRSLLSPIRVQDRPVPV